jgi:hypothetical protein
MSPGRHARYTERQPLFGFTPPSGIGRPTGRASHVAGSHAAETGMPLDTASPVSIGMTDETRPRGIPIITAPTLDSSGTEKVMRSSGVMAAGTAVSRLLGFVRAAVLVAAVQPSRPGHPGLSGDAFQVANTIPNALYILLAGGVLNAVLVPQITRAAKQADGGQEYIDRLLTAAVSILLGVTIAFSLAAPLLIRIYAT